MKAVPTLLPWILGRVLELAPGQSQFPFALELERRGRRGRHRAIGRLRRRPLPPQGRFNAGQKLNTVAIAAATVGFIGTGLIMDFSIKFPPSWSDSADTWHIWLMWICAPLIAGHLILALLWPSTRPALRGIVTGFVRLDFARRRHAKWATTVAPDDHGES